jgi:predicted Zn-dependent protease
VKARAALSIEILLCIASCRNGSPISPPLEIPIYGSCDVEPTYASQVVLNRWPSFPLSYHYRDETFPMEFREEYRSAILDGIRRWDAMTANELGAVVEVDDSEDAQFVISYRAFSPPLIPARTTHGNGQPFLAGGEIWFNPTGLQEGEDLLREGRIQRATFLRVVSSIGAHEMGHLLGIIGHSARPDVLMGTEFIDAPTQMDVNTLIRAYCEP